MLLEAIARIATRADFANTVWLEATAEERAALTVAEVVRALVAAAEALRPRVTGPAVLYVWHDERAAQLRCGVTARPPDDLPFGGDYRVTGDLARIVAPFLAAVPKAAVPLELELTVDDPAPPDDPPLAVWTYPL